LGAKNILKSFRMHPEGIFKFIRFQIKNGISKQSPIFIVGPPRSGTTLLYTKLTSYEGFSGPINETGLFMLRNPYATIVEPIPAPEWISYVRVAKSKAQLLDYALDWFKINQSASFFVEKTPQHCLKFKSIIKMLPNAKFICIIRHPLDCVFSSITNNNLIFQGKDIESSSDYWLKCATSIRAMSNYQNCKIISYENLVTNPSQQLAEILYFLGAENSKIRVTPKLQHKYLQKDEFKFLQGPIISSRIGLWRAGLSRSDQKKSWAIVSELALSFGYNLD